MKYDVTNSEHEILQVMWKAGRPLSRAEILKLSTEKTWKDNSIHILLNGMLDKAQFNRQILCALVKCGHEHMNRK